MKREPYYTDRKKKKLPVPTVIAFNSVSRCVTFSNYFTFVGSLKVSLIN